MLVRSRPLALLLLFPLGAACSAKTPADPPAPRAEVGVLASAQRIAAWDGAITATLRNSTSPWQQIAGKRFAAPLGGFELEIGDGLEVREGDRRALSLLPIGAAVASASIEDGHLVQRAAYPSTDTIWSASRGRVESYYLLRDASAPTSFAWRVAYDPSLRPLADGQAITFVDAANATKLRVSAPIAIDGDGHRAKPLLSLDGDVLTLKLDTRELHYPILLDPAVETPVWEHLCTTAPCNAVLPPGRSSAASAYDENRGVAVVFGGIGVAGPSSPVNDIWEWNGAAFTKSTATGFPGGRWGARLVYDPTLKRILLFGGVTSSITIPNDITAYDGSKWTPVTATGTPAFGGVNMGVAWDSTRNVLVVFGGGYGGTLHSDTFEWSATTGAWTTMAPVSIPDARETTMAFDASQNKVVMFGGTNPGGKYDDTWLYAGGQWTAQTVASKPSKRGDTSLVYESRRKKIILVGGDYLTSMSDDAWEWDGATKTWTAVGKMETGVRSSSAAFDSGRGRVVVLSGSASPGYLSGVFEMHVRGNACAEGCDTASCVDGVCCESTCGACERCDLAATAGVCSTIKDGEGPRCTGASSCDATGACVAKKAKGETCSSSALCSSGFCVDGVCCDSACGSACQACDVTGSIGTCSNVGAGPAHGTRTCAPALCDGASATCPTTCASDAGCASGSFCDATHCVPKHGNGASCASTTQCASGFCVGGICCNSACSGKCGVCDATTGGNCAPIVGVPKGGCGMVGDTTACAARCTGMDTELCHYPPAASVPCSANGCADGSETHASTCDGAGKCNDVARACGAYKCGASSCKTSCTSADDCAPGIECNAGICAPPSVHCSADKSASIDAAGASTLCAPFLCAGTTCANTCGTSADCVSGSVCDTATRLCINSAPSDASGGCSVNGNAPRPIGIGWLLFVAAIAARRRRRREGSLPDVDHASDPLDLGAAGERTDRDPALGAESLRGS